jgi:DNA-binding SARP family transcriptional activator
VRFEILGSLQIVDEVGAVRLVAAPRQRALLATLLLRANHPVPVEELTEMVWDGAPPARAVATLRTYVMRVRRTLGPGAAERIVTRDPGYLVQLDTSELDVLLFEELCQDAGTAVRASAWAEASASATQALCLWRDTPLIDIPSQALRDQWVPRLEQLRLQTVERRIDAELNLGRHDQLVSDLRDLTGRYPLYENFHTQLMLALVGCGQRGEALAAYRQARQVLVDELGIEPGPELRRLQAQILTGDFEPGRTEYSRTSG